MHDIVRSAVSISAFVFFFFLIARRLVRSYGFNASATFGPLQNARFTKSAYCMRDLRDPLNNMRDLSSALMKRGYVTRCISARHCVRSIDDSCLIQSARLSQSALQCATFVVRFIMRDQSDPLPEGFFFFVKRSHFFPMLVQYHVCACAISMIRHFLSRLKILLFVPPYFTQMLLIIFHN